ncbi:MAG: hypothetical protein ACRYF3_07735, partial [Janthinobacterium lividum]
MGRTDGARARRVSPGRLTLLLTAALALAGAALLGVAPGHTLLGAPTGTTWWLLLAALVVALFVTELGQALVEMRLQAYSYSLAGVPLLLGVLYLSPEHAVAARMVTAVAAFAVQRVAPLKFSFNTAAYLLDAALLITLTHLFVGPTSVLSLRTAFDCFLAMAVTDAVMSGFVLLVIRINQGPVSVRDAVQVFAPAAVFVLISTSIAFTTVALVGAGPLGIALFVILAIVTVAAYRGYLVLRRRHHSLELVQEFVALTTRIEDEGADLGREPSPFPVVPLLQHILEVLRAGRLELTLDRPEGGRSTHVLDVDGRHEHHDSPITA